MKKLFSYVLALTLLVSTMSVSFAAPADVTEKTQMQAVDVLMALGVVNGFPDGTYKPGEDVTRAQMAKLIVTALGFEDYAADNKSSFTDMENHWAKGYVETCVGLGIIKGYPDGTFRPENKVTYNEAATILVRALGWTDEAIKGTWPTNYVTKAMALKIFDDVKYTAGAADRGNVAVLLFNTLHLPIGTVDQNGAYDDGVTKDDNGNRTWRDDMYRRLNVKSIGHGVVTGKEDTVLNLRAQVGTYVEKFQKTVAPYEHILFMNDSTNLVGKFNAKLDTFKTTVDEVEYYTAGRYNGKDGKKHVENYTTNVLVFENGDFQGKEGENLKAALLKLYDGNETDEDKKLAAVTGSQFMVSANVSGKTFKNVYAVSKWDVTKHEVITAKHLKTIEKDKELLGQKFKKDDDGNIDLKSFELLGAEKLADIKENDVVYVYTGKDYIRKVAVGTKTLDEVEVTWVNSDKNEFKIDGEKYELADPAAKDNTVPVAGDKVNVRFDYYGKVYFSETITAVKNYAVVLGKGDDVGIKKVRLFLADGTEKVFTYKKLADGLTLAEGDLVEYTLDGDKVKEITKNVIITKKNLDDKVSKSTYLVGGNIITDKTVVFVYNGKGVTDAANYSVIEREKVADKEIEANALITDKKVNAMVITDGVSAAPVYALFNSFAGISGGTRLDLIIAKAENEKQDSTIAFDDVPAKANGKLYLVEYNTENKVSKLTATSGAAVTVATTTVDKERELTYPTFASDAKVKVIKYTPDLKAKFTAKYSGAQVVKFGVKDDFESYVLLSDKVEYVKMTKDDKYEVKDQDAFTAAFDLEANTKLGSLVLWDVDGDKAFDLVVYTVEKKN